MQLFKTADYCFAFAYQLFFLRSSGEGKGGEDKGYQENFQCQDAGSY